MTSTSFLENIRFTENKTTGEIHGGMHLTSILGSSIQGGGANHQFENFIVPMGLIVENRPSVIHKMAMMNEGYQDVLSDSIFDRLFEKMVK
jgi:hypothetical protein